MYIFYSCVICFSKTEENRVNHDQLILFKEPAEIIKKKTKQTSNVQIKKNIVVKYICLVVLKDKLCLDDMSENDELL